MSKEIETHGSDPAVESSLDAPRRGSIAATEKGRWERLWPVIACGAGLFSDGFLNNVSIVDAEVVCIICLLTWTDYWSSKHHAQDDIPRIVQELVGAGKYLKYHVCRDRVGHAILWVYV
jgi:hypothetical protein